MEIDKAIEIMALNLKAAGKQMPPDVQDAIVLLIKCGFQVKETEAVLNGENRN